MLGQTLGHYAIVASTAWDRIVHRGGAGIYVFHSVQADGAAHRLDQLGGVVADLVLEDALEDCFIASSDMAKSRNCPGVQNASRLLDQ